MVTVVQMSIFPSVVCATAVELLDLQVHLLVVEGLVVVGGDVVPLTLEVRDEQRLLPVDFLAQMIGLVLCMTSNA